MDDQKRATIQRMEDVLQAALELDGKTVIVQSKSMFGGAGYYADGWFVAAWFGESLALKLSEADRAELLQIEGAKPAMSQQYVEVPPAWLDDPAQLAPWVGRSLAFVMSGKQKKKKA